MFANPEVSSFIDRLIGGQPPHLGAPPPTPGYRGALARGLFGDVSIPKIGGFQAPAIRAGRGLEAPRASEGVGRSVGSGQPSQAEFRPPSGSTGASELSAGLQKLGSGIEGGLEQLAANKQNADETAALSQGGAWKKFVPMVSGDGTSAVADSSSSLPSFARQAGVGTETPTTAPGDYLAKVQAIENPSGSPYATSSTGATGKWQFIPSTWRQFGAGGNIHDPAAQDAAMARFTQSNYAALQSGLGRPPTDGELYLAHQQGAAGALKLLQNPNVPAGQLVGSQAISVNGGNPNAPASAFVNKWGSRFGGAQSYADQTQDRQQDAADAGKPAGSQAVIPGQNDPHKPGFDPNSVSFSNTPIGQRQSSSDASTTPPAPISGVPNAATQTGIYNGQPYLYQTQPALGQQGMLQDQNVSPLALALAGGQMPMIDPNFGGGGVLFG